MTAGDTSQNGVLYGACSSASEPDLANCLKCREAYYRAQQPATELPDDAVTAAVTLGVQSVLNAYPDVQDELGIVERDVRLVVEAAWPAIAAQAAADERARIRQMAIKAEATYFDSTTIYAMRRKPFADLIGEAPESAGTRDRSYQIPDEHLIVVSDTTKSGLDTWDF